MIPGEEKSAFSLPRKDGCFSADGLDCLGIDYFTNQRLVCQETKFNDHNEIAEKFSPKKVKSFVLADSYLRLGLDSKAHRVADCGTLLSFTHAVIDGHIESKGKLYSANFCRDRLCPMCSWRRSYKIFGQVSQIMDLIQDDFKFLFVTLTIPNCSADDLNSSIDLLMKAWAKLIKYKELRFVKGFFRALEITRNDDLKSSSYGTYHPHFHVVFAVPKSYGKRFYLTHDRLLALWQKATKDDHITQVDIRVAKPKVSGDQQFTMGAVVAEIAKYTVKDSDYLFAGDPAKTDSVVSVLNSALFHRRLVAYGGCFKSAFDKLLFDDPEDGDLVHVNESINATVVQLIVKYGWSCGIYKMTDVSILLPREEV